MGVQIKKRARSFSFTNEEMALVLDRTKHHGFKDRNEYVLALVESDVSLAFEVGLNGEKQKILRPAPNPELSKALHKLSAGGTSQPFGKRGHG